MSIGFILASPIAWYSVPPWIAPMRFWAKNIGRMIVAGMPDARASASDRACRRPLRVGAS
jgi:hypothetical protein